MNGINYSLLTDLVEHISEGLYILDSKDNLIYCNQAFANILGAQNPSEITGKLYHDFLSSSNKTELLKFFRSPNHKYNNKPLETISETFALPYQNQIYSVRVLSLTNPEGEVRGRQGIVLDISNTYKNPAQVSDSERIFKDLFENLPEASAVFEIVCTHNNQPVDFILRDCNGAFLKITGANYTEALGQSLHKLIPALSNIPIHYCPKQFE